jgi:hypothetical protein
MDKKKYSHLIRLHVLQIVVVGLAFLATLLAVWFTGKLLIFHWIMLVGQPLIVWKTVLSMQATRRQYRRENPSD